MSPSVQPVLHCLRFNQEEFTMMHAAVGFWILSALICVGRGDHHYGLNHHDQHTELDTHTNSVSWVTAANKEFAFRLYRKLAAHADSEGKNIFFSPVSVSVALAALAVGARGETHHQLFSGLGFNNTLLTQSVVDHAFHMLMERAHNTSHEDVSEGTAVFVDNRFKPQPAFLETLRQSYSADGFNVDFAQTKESADTINKYVGEKTNGKIDKLVESMDPNTVMYLLSYIYYKGKWATPFDTDLTKEDVFMVDENTKVPVQMMNMEERLDTYYDQAINTSVLHLPFNNSYSMLLLLPDDMATLENAICPGHVTKWLKWMKSRTYNIYIPKFSIKSSYNLNDVLQEMGMTDMFGDRADLSGISEGQKLAVSEVVHQATLDVDEAGATAAAATGIGITLLSFRHVPVLKFNRPFMVAITERDTENILFLGKIINPTI
ncbi:serpin A3-2-like [Epinephelus moara]|uniref:serpin A3-2-like n=1 Tax=Epinephelus moara TaxID=300413 RepID=UPI00214F2C35|nr:serpin A3-2-like [Epinephelus moara]